MTPAGPSGSYLAHLDEHSLAGLQQSLSPALFHALTTHLSRRSEPSPRSKAPLLSSMDSPAPPLLTVSKLKAILPAVLPATRTWLMEQDSAARREARSQKVLQAMACHVVRMEEALDVAEVKAQELHRLSERQLSALVASAARCERYREGYQQERAARLKEGERARQLERALRATLREEMQREDSALRLEQRDTNSSSVQKGLRSTSALR